MVIQKEGTVMNITRFSIALLILLSGTVLGQKKGDIELSVAGTFGSSNMSRSGSSSDTKFAVLSVSSGFYLIDGLSLEPEIGWIAMEDDFPGWLFLGNLSYTYPEIDQQHRIAPFIRIGYGVSNSYQLLTTQLLIRTGNKLDVGVLNVGGGVKVGLVESAFLRAEVFYRQYNWTYNDSYYDYTSRRYLTQSIDYKLTNIGMSMGVSIIL
jgi:hypothetical protein